ncbi:TonB-dependent receptor-like protein [Azotobacter chroococcum]|uniref:TonB-dependent receptor-like protein n=1 Tax=Azotobacter chroococcum TaxID=353 RepID=A0A4R1PRN7_9GAMM|nr:TonB-dependent receptor-like protein [Azotobacter chroococcum]
MTRSRLALAALLLPAPLLAAEPADAPPAYRLPTQAVTSPKSADFAEPASAAATLFERDDIERLQVQSVPELLNRVPGVTVVQAGGRGALSGVFIRGATPTQTLVLVDGVRINAAVSGLARLEFLDPGRIERIEVIRGPQASQYGADAIGGLIRITTRRGESGLQPRLRLAAGNRGSFERELGLSGGDDRTRFDLGASQAESQGFDRGSDDRGRDADHDGFRRRALDLTLEHRFTDSLQAGLTCSTSAAKASWTTSTASGPAIPTSASPSAASPPISRPGRPMPGPAASRPATSRTRARTATTTMPSTTTASTPTGTR